jgi:hypothetical protein
MRASGRAVRKKLHVFDNFLWREFMADRAELPIRPGDSFKRFFMENVRDYGDIIDCHVCALSDEPIVGDREAAGKRFSESERVPILEGFNQGLVEILFIDGAKSWRGMRHLLKVFGDKLIPGKTKVVCQDYKYWSTYWVAAVMARLGNYLKPVHNVLGGTAVTFLLNSPIPIELIEGIEDHVNDAPVPRTLADLEEASTMLEKDGDALGAAHLLLSKVSFLCHRNELEEAVRQFRYIQRHWPSLDHVGQLERAREYLRVEKSVKIPRPKRMQLILGMKKIRRKLKS